jgi:ATP phosphoribosyltransferase
MITVAIPNKGALSDATVAILKDAGYSCQRWSRELIVRDREHEVEFVFLRPRDIAVYVNSGLLDAGITGRDLMLDSRANVAELLALGYGKSRFFFAVPKEKEIGIDDLNGYRIATSYPNLVEDSLRKRGISANIVELDGAVEISIRLGVADAIADVVESGRTLDEAGLKTIGDPIMQSEAVVIAKEEKANIPAIQSLIKRLEGILVARAYCLLEYVIPMAVLEQACAITPGVKSPTLSPVHDSEWMAVAAMVKRKGLNRTIDTLSALGAKGIIAHQIQTCRL